MPKGISLHVGLNRLDPAHYGTDGALAGCENDARAMLHLASSLGFTSSALLTTAAAADDILAAVRSIALQLESGDCFLFTYAGHGAQIPDVNGDESDSQDETWCVYDRMILDDELAALWGTFKPGVLIVVVSDSCHSGTVVRLVIAGRPPMIPRALPAPVAEDVVRRNRSLYANIRSATARAPQNIDAALIALSACRDDQLSADGVSNGLFTEKLLQVWDGGRYTGNYPDLIAAIQRLMPDPGLQTPQYMVLGAGSAFLPNRPFALPETGPAGVLEPVTDQLPGDVPDSGGPAMTPAGSFPTPSPQLVGCGKSKHPAHTQRERRKAKFTFTLEKEHLMETFVDNGNWEEVASALSQQSTGARGLDTFMTRVIATNAQAAQQAYAASVGTNGAATATRGGSGFAAYWWGFHVQISREDLNFLLNATDPNGPVVAFLRVVIPQQYQYWISIITPFVVASATLLRAIDRGRGVYISMSWFAPGVFVPTSV